MPPNAMRLPLLLLGAALALPAVSAGRTFHSGIQVLDLELLEDSAVVGVTHPAAPLFRTDEDGFPIVSGAGYVALRDQGEGFVYSTRQIAEWNGRGPSPEEGHENWGQIEAFSCVARALREMRQRLPGHTPVHIGHISGEHGGFPDLEGHGYSGHLSHQTGLHFNFRLPPREGVHQRVYALPNQPQPFNRPELLTLLDILLRHGAQQIVTNREVVDRIEARAETYPSLRQLPEEGVSTKHGMSYWQSGVGALILFDEPGDHADHCNVVFWPAK